MSGDNKKQFLSAEAILSAPKFSIHELEVPELGGTVYLKTWSGREQDTFEQSIVSYAGQGDKVRVNLRGARALAATLSLCDVDGKRLFKIAHQDKLADVAAPALERIFQKVREINNLDDSVLEDIEENLE